MVRAPLHFHGRIPVPEVAPLTYRDGVTLLEQVYELSQYLKKILHPSLQSTVDQVVTDTEQLLDEANTQYVDGVEEFQRIHDRFMSDVHGSLIALNDTAVSDLLDDATSLLYQSVVDNTAQYLRERHRTITSQEWGIDPTVDPATLSGDIQEFWDYTAEHGYTAIMLPGQYVIDHPTGSPNAMLTVPSGSDIIFRPGTKFTRAEYHPSTPTTSSRMVVINASSHNSTLSGTLELDGRGNNISWHSEHNHCLFIYNAQHVDATSLHITTHNAMADGISFSGSGNHDQTTKNVWIGSVELYGAGRASLVVEGTIDCGINNAYIDNTNGPLSFAYEPFGIQEEGFMSTFRIESLYATGVMSGTAGTQPLQAQKAHLSGGHWVFTLPSDNIRQAMLLYGMNLDVDKITIDAREAIRTQESLVQLAYGIFFKVGTLEILTPAGYDNTVFHVSTSLGLSPTLDIETLRLLGEGNHEINIQASGIIDNLEIRGEDAQHTRITLGGSYSGNAGGSLRLNSVQLINCHNPDHIFRPNTLAVGERYTRIGEVDVTQTDGRVSGSLFHMSTLTSSSLLLVEDISVNGEAFATLVTNSGGGHPVLRHTMNPERATYYGENSSWSPQSRYPASPGSSVTSTLDGTVWVKRSGTGTTGWETLN